MTGRASENGKERATSNTDAWLLDESHLESIIELQSPPAKMIMFLREILRSSAPKPTPLCSQIARVHPRLARFLMIGPNPDYLRDFDFRIFFPFPLGLLQLLPLLIICFFWLRICSTRYPILFSTKIHLWGSVRSMIFLLSPLLFVSAMGRKSNMLIQCAILNVHYKWMNFNSSVLRK